MLYRSRPEQHPNQRRKDKHSNMNFVGDNTNKGVHHFTAVPPLSVLFSINHCETSLALPSPLLVLSPTGFTRRMITLTRVFLCFLAPVGVVTNRVYKKNDYLNPCLLMLLHITLNFVGDNTNKGVESASPVVRLCFYSAYMLYRSRPQQHPNQRRKDKHSNMNFVGDNTNKGVGDNTNKGVRIQENVESTLAMGPWRLES